MSYFYGSKGLKPLGLLEKMRATKHRLYLWAKQTTNYDPRDEKKIGKRHDE